MPPLHYNNNNPSTTIRRFGLCIVSLCFVVARVKAFHVHVGHKTVVSSGRRFNFHERWGIVRPRAFLSASKRAEDENDDDDASDFFEAELPDSNREQQFSREEIESLTVTVLKQQLRLRGLKVSGRKSELVDRFLQSQKSNSAFSDSIFSSDDSKNGEDTKQKNDKARKFAEEHGKDLVDVADYVEDEDRGKDTKTWKARVGINEIEDEEEDWEQNESREPEVWGMEARIVDDYEGGRMIVDCLSQSVVEFQGSNQSYVQALVVASRDALRPYLAGGRHPTNTSARASITKAEVRLREIQSKREQESRRPVRWEDQAGLDEGDEYGIYKDALHRDFSDWGSYTTTGAQLSAGEVQGVLLLSDVYGAFTEDMRVLAEKIAFECQPVVVMVPDMFRGDPWTGPISGLNERGETYEQWRAQHSDLRVNIDIRAAAASLRERYGVSSVVVWGMCFGGGRALEAAAGWIPDKNIHDVNGKVGPPPVDPMACVAWYPTRYNLNDIFGKKHMGTVRDMEGNDRTMAVMAVFAGKDTIPGARPSDADALKKALVADKRVKDHMVKVFPDQDHGFAHQGLGNAPGSGDNFGSFVDEEFGGAGQISFADGDAEVACLLSTAFMETYSRVFLPTVGPPISLDPSESLWNEELSMNGRVKENGKRDVRKEIEENLDNFVEEPLGGYRIDPNDPSQEEDLIRLLRSMETPEQKASPFAIADDDDLSTIYGKLKTADENFQIF